MEYQRGYDKSIFRITHRDIGEYQRLLGFSLDALKPSAWVLDLGSGKFQEFARGSATNRSDLTVISVDPSLGLPIKDEEIDKLKVSYQIMYYGLGKRPISEQEDRILRRKNVFGNVTAALATYLPFRNEVFDYIFDNHGAFTYSPAYREELLKKYLQELLRVLKPSGIISIYPGDLMEELTGLRKLEIDRKIELVKTHRLKLIRELGIDDYSEFFLCSESPEEPNLTRVGIKIEKP